MTRRRSSLEVRPVSFSQVLSETMSYEDRQKILIQEEIKARKEEDDFEKDALEKIQTTLTKYKDQANIFISSRLGFFPNPSQMLRITLPIRAQLANAITQQFSVIQVIQETNPILIDARNQHCRIASIDLGKDVELSYKHLYESENLAYATQARNILVNCVGYEPMPCYSQLSELWLRSLLKDGRDPMGYKFRMAVHQSAWETLFAETYFEKGLKAAQNLPLSAINIEWDPDSTFGLNGRKQNITPDVFEDEILAEIDSQINWH